MTAQTLLPSNGAGGGQGRSQSNALWLQESVQQFFGGFNWEDNPPEMQQVKLTSLQASTVPLNLTLTVGQFFAGFNWDGTSIAAAPLVSEPPLRAAIEVTVDDFFSQF